MTLQVIKTICLVVMLLCVYLIHRNDRVYEYQTDLNHRCYEICSAYCNTLPNDEEYYEKIEKQWDLITSISYVKMLFMFWRPLKDEYWLAEEQIDFLNRTII